MGTRGSRVVLRGGNEERSGGAAWGGEVCDGAKQVRKSFHPPSGLASDMRRENAIAIIAIHHDAMHSGPLRQGGVASTSLTRLSHGSSLRLVTTTLVANPNPVLRASLTRHRSA